MTEIEGMLDFLSGLRRGRPHDQPRLRVRRRQGRHDQAPQPPAGGLLPDPRGHARKVQGPDASGATVTRSSARRSTTSSSQASASWNAPPGPSPRATSPAGGGRATSWRARGISRRTRRCSGTSIGASSAWNQDTGKARDPRCDNCMTQCGFEPSGALSSTPRWTTLGKTSLQLRPPPQAHRQGRGGPRVQRRHRRPGPPHRRAGQEEQSPLAEADVMPEPAAYRGV